MDMIPAFLQALFGSRKRQTAALFQYPASTVAADAAPSTTATVVVPTRLLDAAADDAVHDLTQPATDECGKRLFSDAFDDKENSRDGGQAPAPPAKQARGSASMPALEEQPDEALGGATTSPYLHPTHYSSDNIDDDDDDDDVVEATPSSPQTRLREDEVALALSGSEDACGVRRALDSDASQPARSSDEMPPALPKACTMGSVVLEAPREGTASRAMTAFPLYQDSEIFDFASDEAECAFQPPAKPAVGDGAASLDDNDAGTTETQVVRDVADAQAIQLKVAAAIRKADAGQWAVEARAAHVRAKMKLQTIHSHEE